MTTYQTWWTIGISSTCQPFARFAFDQSPSLREMAHDTTGCLLPALTPVVPCFDWTPATSTIEGDAAPTVPPRPQRPSMEPVKRYSMNVSRPGDWRCTELTKLQGLSTTPTNGSASNNSFNRSSLLAPRVISISDNSWVRCEMRGAYGRR